MARENTSWDARFFDVITTPSTGVNLCSAQCRTAANAEAVGLGQDGSPFAGTSYPNMWLRLQRTGNVFEGFRSADGVNWISLGQTNIDMASIALVGLATTAHDYAGAGQVTTAQYRDITVVNGPLQTKIIGLGGNLSFGNVTVGMTAQATLTIANTGNSALTVNSISYPDGFSGAWSGSIAANGSQPVTVTFAPTSTQVYGGTVTVNSDKTAGLNTISISGMGIPMVTRIIGLGGNLSFGNVTVGTTAQATLTIANTGNSALTVSSISYPDGFSGEWSGSIPANGFQSVPVTFAPTAAQGYGDSVTVNSDKTAGVNTISISGTGIPMVMRIIGLGGNLSFGNVTVGTTAQATLTIANTGNSALTVSSVSYPDGLRRVVGEHPGRWLPDGAGDIRADGRSGLRGQRDGQLRQDRRGQHHFNLRDGRPYRHAHHWPKLSACFLEFPS